MSWLVPPFALHRGVPPFALHRGVRRQRLYGTCCSRSGPIGHHTTPTYVSTAILHKLVECLREKVLLQDTRGVAVEEQVAIFIYAISKNASNRHLQWRFQHSGETISRHFGAVLRAMIQLTRSYIQLPPVNIPYKISSNSKFMPYFKVLVLPFHSYIWLYYYLQFK